MKQTIRDLKKENTELQQQAGYYEKKTSDDLAEQCKNTLALSMIKASMSHIQAAIAQLEILNNWLY